MYVISLLMLLVTVAVVCMLVITTKVQRGFRRINYISGVKYGKVVQQLQDKHELHRYGIGQYLRRQYGELSIFSIAMNAIGMFPMLLLLLAPILQQGGLSASLFIYCGLGVLFIIFMTLTAQYLSAQPTAGGLYHAALREGGRWLGSIVGGVQLIGQIMMLIGYSIGLVYFSRLLIPSALEWLDRPNATLLTVILVLLAQLLIIGFKSSSYRFFHIAAWLVQCAGIAWLLIALIASWRSYSYNGMHLFMTGTAVEGWFPALHEVTPLNWGLLIALIARLFIGGDSSSQHAEETLEPKVKISWATLLSTCYSFMIGLALLLILAIYYMNQAYTTSGLTGEQWLQQLAGQFGSGLIVIALLSSWCSSVTLLQSAGRTLMAMARDGMLPFKQTLSMMNYLKQVPQRALIVVILLSLALLVPIYFFSASQLFVHVTLLAVICHCIVYVLVFFFVPVKGRAELWKVDGWEKGIRVCGMLLLTALGSIVAAALPLSIMLVAAVPVIIIVCYAVIYGLLIKGLANKFFTYDSNKSRDLFEVEGEMPLQ